MRAAVPYRLSHMLTRLKLTAILDQLDGLLHEAGRPELRPLSARHRAGRLAFI